MNYLDRLVETAKLSGKKGWRSYVECYMLPTYVGDIADLTGRRADKTEIADILEKDGLKFSEKDMVTIDETKWHVTILFVPSPSNLLTPFDDVSSVSSFECSSQNYEDNWDQG